MGSLSNSQFNFVLCKEGDKLITNEPARVDLNNAKFHLDRVDSRLKLSAAPVVIDYRAESMFRAMAEQTLASQFFSGFASKRLTIQTGDWSLDYAENCVRQLQLSGGTQVTIELFPVFHLQKLFDKKTIWSSYLSYEEKAPAKPAISMNRAINRMRVEIMRHILGSGLEQQFFLSWLNRYGSDSQGIKTRTLDSEDADSTQHSFPDEYTRAVLDVFAESNDLEKDLCPPFLTEKTWRPLLTGKPFWGYLGPNCYNYLKQLGFELYEELIDYSYDADPNPETRFEKYLSELDRLIEVLSPERWPDRRHIIASKIEHNRSLAKRLAQTPQAPTASREVTI